MFVLNNAWTALGRHKWRTALAVVVTMAATFSTFFGLAVSKATTLATGTSYRKQMAGAVIRTTPATNARRNGADPAWTRHYLTWNDYTTYATAAQNAGLQFSYSFAESIPVRQTSSLKPISSSPQPNASKTGGEFTLRSFYTSESAKTNEFGRFGIVSGKNLNYTSTKNSTGALISQELAEANNLKVGDTFTVANPTAASTTYKLTVQGIYRYTSPASSSLGLSATLAKDDRENAIYTTYYTFAKNKLDATGAQGWSIPDLNIMFTLSNVKDYETFVSAVKKAKLAGQYEVSSPTLAQYKASIAPLESLNATMRVVLIVAWSTGALLLLGFTVMELSRRRGEIGYGIVVGLSRSSLGLQMMLEIILPLLFGFAVGGFAGGFASAPLGNWLSHGQSTVPSAPMIWEIIGFGLLAITVLGIIAVLRVAFFRTASLLENRQTPDTSTQEAQA